MLDKIEDTTPGRATGMTPSAIAVEIDGVSLWHGSVAHINHRFVRNESLQILIELWIATRHVEDHADGRVRDRQLECLLKDITVKIERGSVVGIIDIGGLSRYALLPILANCEAPSRGTVRYFGKMVAVRQAGASALPHSTCRENLELGARYLGFKRDDVRAALERVPDFSGLGQHLDTPLRRVPRQAFGDLGLSLICCLDHDILIADDIGRPRSEGLAANWEAYLEQAPKMGKTVILSSRNTKKLPPVCTHLMLIDETELLAYGPTQEMRAQHAAFLRTAAETPVTLDRTLGETIDEEEEESEFE